MDDDYQISQLPQNLEARYKADWVQWTSLQAPPNTYGNTAALVNALSVAWHTFRHPYRSWLDGTGVPVRVQQKLMRHAQVSTTMNVYGTL